ncbi:hypothetical protein SteCoe_8769 [Stentor coeruleus]|uniref:Polymerase nucleotidyl transferase domain-containing protein n=1 Tax=Stentor coeruleus TaxID=5963 RepID=A0A1R2CJG8_9CILI|nr:hypothetical protein SteCoe_8769 [Stentor coeruleus]
MELIAQSFCKGNQGLLEYLNSLEEYNKFTVGLIIGMKATKSNSELTFLNVLWKMIININDNKDLLSIKYLYELKNTIHSVNKKNPIYLLNYLLESLDKIGKIITFTNDSSTEIKNIIKTEAGKCYTSTVKLYSNKCEVIKVLRFSLVYPEVFPNTFKNLLNLSEIDELINIVDDEDITKACETLRVLCDRLDSEKNNLLHKFTLNAIVFLLETKAEVLHAKAIFYYLREKPEYIDQEFKEKVANAYYECCERLNFKSDEELVRIIEGNMNWGNMEVGRNDGGKIIEKGGEGAKGKKKEGEMLGQKEKKCGNEEKKYNDKKNIKNKDRNLGKEGEKYENTEIKFTKEEKKHENTEIKFTNEEKKLENHEKEEKKQLEGNKNKQNYDKSNKNPNPQSYQKVLIPESKPETRNTSSKMPIEEKKIPVDTQITNLLEEAQYLFDHGQRIEIGEFYESFQSINYENQPSKLFEKIDVAMSAGKPNERKCIFWKTMLKIFDKLPQLDQYHIAALRDKIKSVKGNVRKNKEKVSHQKEAKKQFKEELKKQDKFIENFKGGDREQKRALKTNPEVFQEISSLSQALCHLSQDALSIIRNNSLDAGILTLIQQDMQKIKSTLSIISNTCTTKVIGSASMGTCLKNTPIDILITEKSGQYENLIEKAFPSAKKSQLGFFSHKMDSDYTFHIYTNIKFASEVSALIKKYCLVDTRINELIMFIKFWAKENGLMCISGFQWSLLTISYLQNTEPPVITSLQAKEHKQKIVNGADVWFDTDFNMPSANCCTLGQLIYMMFLHFAVNCENVSDICTGKTRKHLTCKFVTLHPFTGEEIGNELGLHEQDEVEKCFKAAMEVLVNGQGIYTLMKLKSR